MPNAAYVDPNITAPVETVFTQQTIDDGVPLTTLPRLAPHYEAPETDRSAATQQPPLPHKSSFWQLGRDLYANNGAVEQPFFG